MLINTGLLVTSDVGDRAQSLASASSTAESRLLFRVIQPLQSSYSEAL